MRKYHVHGVFQVNMCFNLEAENMEHAMREAATILKQVDNEAQVSKKSDGEPTVITLPDECVVHDVIAAVSDGEKENDELWDTEYEEEHEDVTVH